MLLDIASTARHAVKIATLALLASPDSATAVAALERGASRMPEETGRWLTIAAMGIREAEADAIQDGWR